MARYFNGSSRIALADNAALAFGSDVDNDGPFSFSFWIKYYATSNAGTQFIASWGNYKATPSFNIITYNDLGSNPGRLLINVEGGNGSNASLLTDTAMNDSAWHHVAIVFDGSVLRAYVDGAVETTTTTKADLDRVDVAEPWRFGVRSLLYSYLDAADMAEWAKWDLELSAEQITALAAGVRPVDIGQRPDWYVPMLGDLHEEINDIAITYSGTAIAEHPPKIVPAGSMI